MFFHQGALNVPQIPRFSSCFHFQFSKQTLWQDNMQKKNDVLEQFFAFFQLVLVM